MEELLSPRLRDLRAQLQEITAREIAPKAAETDATATWPAHALAALQREGLAGLQVPEAYGGKGQGLLALALATETVAQGCPSAAMCFGMHCVGTAVIAAKATRDQAQRYLEPIAAGRHITTLALSESGTGAHFYLPQTRLTRTDDGFLVDGEKQFVTNGGHADSYVVSTLASEATEAGEFSCLMVDRDAAGSQWLDPWHGVGMRGNSSRGLRLDGVRVPRGNLLGEEGDQVWYAFEVVAPYFLTAMAGCYLGIAQAAFDLTLAHVRGRRYAHSGEGLADVVPVQHMLAEMWTDIAKTRALVYRAAYLGDTGDAEALLALLAAKADVGDTAVKVTNEAMTVCGGMGYRENGALARLLRDARAAHVMTPTTLLTRGWLGRALLGLPLV